MNSVPSCVSRFLAAQLDAARARYPKRVSVATAFHGGQGYLQTYVPDVGNLRPRSASPEELAATESA